MTQIDYLSSQNPLGPGDRKRVLLVWGIILIALGAGGVFFDPDTAGLVIPASSNVSTRDPLHVRQVISAGLMYLSVAVAFVWIGIGSIRCQRWVRPIVIVVSVLWLIVGIVGTIAALIGLARATGCRV